MIVKEVIRGNILCWGGKLALWTAHMCSVRLQGWAGRGGLGCVVSRGGRNALSTLVRPSGSPPTPHPRVPRMGTV